MNNDAPEKSATGTPESHKTPPSQPSKHQTSDEYVVIPMTGRAPVRLKNKDWPIMFECELPIRKRCKGDEKYLSYEFSIFSWLMNEIGVTNITGPYAPELPDDYEYELLPTDYTVYSPVAMKTQNASYIFSYYILSFFLRCHKDGRALLSVTYENANGEIIPAGGTLFEKSVDEEEFSVFLRNLFSNSNINANWANEYNWVAKLFKAYRTPIKKLSQGPTEEETVHFIDEKDQLVSFLKSEWPVTASSYSKKGKIPYSRSKDEPGFLYEHLEVRQHQDGRTLIHAYQKYKEDVMKWIGVKDHLFDIFLMSRGTVIPQEGNHYQNVQNLIQRMGINPTLGAICMNALPPEDLV